MMLNVVDWRQTVDRNRQRFRQRRSEVSHFAKVMETISEHLPARPASDDKCGFLKKIGSGITADRDGIDFGRRDSSDLEAAPDRHLRKAGEVFHPAESFFFESRDELAVAQEDG